MANELILYKVMFGEEMWGDPRLCNAWQGMVWLMNLFCLGRGGASSGGVRLCVAR